MAAVAALFVAFGLPGRVRSPGANESTGGAPPASVPGERAKPDFTNPAAVVRTFLDALAADDDQTMSSCMSAEAVGIAVLVREKRLNGPPRAALRTRFRDAQLSGAATIKGVEIFDAELTILPGGHKVTVVREVDLGHGLLVSCKARADSGFGLLPNTDVESNRDVMASLLGEKAIRDADAVTRAELQEKFKGFGVGYETDAKNRIRKVFRHAELSGGRNATAVLQVGWDGRNPTFQGARAPRAVVEHWLGEAAVAKASSVLPPAPVHTFPSGRFLAIDLGLDSRGRINSASYKINVGEGRRGDVVVRISPDNQYQGILIANAETARYVLGEGAVSKAAEQAMKQLTARPAGKAASGALRLQNLSTDAAGRITVMVFSTAGPAGTPENLVAELPPPGDRAGVHWAIANLGD